MADPVTVTSHRVVLDPGALADLADRLTRTRRAPDLTGWECGLPRRELDALVADWAAFDTAALQGRLDALPHRRAVLDGRGVHLLEVAGQGPDPLPLVLTHGWPGSFLEHLPVLDALSDPAAYGGDPADAFTVVVPSLPGYAFSDPPPARGLTARETAGLWHRILTEGLGHARYVAHGSDLGAGVTAWLARDHPEAVAGIHLASPALTAVPAASGARSPAEDAYNREVRTWQAAEGGYMHEHATKPATLAAGLTDSPAGLAAWIAEKVVAWSSVRSDGSPAFDRELLLATLTLYWATNTIATSLLPYWVHRDRGPVLPVDDPPDVPVHLSLFGGERTPLPKPPRELAERFHRIASWADHPVGGHFPSVAEPALLVTTLRDAFRPLRS